MSSVEIIRWAKDFTKQISQVENVSDIHISDIHIAKTHRQDNVIFNILFKQSQVASGRGDIHHKIRIKTNDPLTATATTFITPVKRQREGVVSQESGLSARSHANALLGGEREGYVYVLTRFEDI